MSPAPTKVAGRLPNRAAIADAQRRYEHELLCRYARTRAPDLREELVRRFMPLARSLALRYRTTSEHVDDLVQVASLGLVKAIDGFDPARGRPFAAYAVPTMLGELRRHLRDHTWSVHLPRGLQERTLAVDNAVSELGEELRASPTPRQVAERLRLSVEEVLEAMRAGEARRASSLDVPWVRDEEESSPAVEMLGDVELGYERVEAAQAAASAGLSERDWQVLRLRFVENLTQREIGERLGVSQMQISRIMRRALRRLLSAVQGEEVLAA